MAVRRAQRSTPSRQAKALSRANDTLARTTRETIDKKIARGIQEFAVRSMNSLAQAGPAWTGEFSASWGFAPEGVQPVTSGLTGGVYKYTKYDVPIKYVQKLIESGQTKFTISNTSNHAAIAVDEEEAMFAPPAYQPYPVGDVVKFGSSRPSQEHLRWQIRDDAMDEEVTSQITAEKDWYPNYLLGGGLQKDLNLGFSFGFEAAQ